MSQSLQVVTDDTLSDVIAANETVILDIWAPWCAPCKMIMPVLEQLTTDIPSVTFIKLNADESNKLGDMGVRGIPTLIKYVNGVETARTSGGKTRADLEAFING